MNNLFPKIFIALIGGCAGYFLSNKSCAIDDLFSKTFIALLGGCIGYFFSNKKYVNEKQREAYAEYLDALQNYINTPEKKEFSAFQKATNKVLLFADDKIAEKVNNYFDDCTTRGKRTLSAEEHKNVHDMIFKAMRKELGLSNKKIGTCSISKYDPQAKKR